jgi:hypothetical protein
MATIDKVNFALFVNKQKRGEKSPDYRGVITMLDGTRYEVAAWLKTAASTGEYIFGIVGEVEGAWKARQQAQGVTTPASTPAPAMRAAVAPTDDDDDIPF